jgi:hypothetical protein
MHRPDAVLADVAVFVDQFLDLVSRLVAVGKSCGRTHIAGNQELSVPGDHTPRSTAIAGGPFGNSVADLHEILIPTWAYMLIFFHNCC